MAEDFDQASLSLAMDFESMAEGQNAAIVVRACAWLLADVIIQCARQEGRTSLDQALKDCLDAVRDCAALMATMELDLHDRTH
jgi:hypothetical protein